MDVRKEHLEKPWPPHDREVGVVLVAHSMGSVFHSSPDDTVLTDEQRLRRCRHPLPGA